MLYEVITVEETGNNEIDQIGNIVGMMIETRVGWQDDSPGARQPQHVLQMDDRERGFTWNQDQLASFLDYHVGGALDQIA